MKPKPHQYCPEDILLLLQRHSPGRTFTTSQIQYLAEEELGMSSATFYRNWKKVVKSPDLQSRNHNPACVVYFVVKNAKIERPDIETAAASKAAIKARQMPPLTHWDRSEDFEFSKSEAYRWLVAQEKIAQKIWDHYRQQLVFNKETRKWNGIDYNKK